MAKIDMVKVVEEGKDTVFVCGYQAAYAPAKDLRAPAHSYNGYALSSFASQEEAEKNYEQYYPDCSLQYCGVRRVLENVWGREIASTDVCGVLPKDASQVKRLRRRIEDHLRKLPERAFSELVFIADYLGVSID
jgi:hypothetical protein